jgi:hypothetical protein
MTREEIERYLVAGKTAGTTGRGEIAASRLRVLRSPRGDRLREDPHLTAFRFRSVSPLVPLFNVNMRRHATQRDSEMSEMACKLLDCWTLYLLPKQAVAWGLSPSLLKLGDGRFCSTCLPASFHTRDGSRNGCLNCGAIFVEIV